MIFEATSQALGELLDFAWSVQCRSQCASYPLLESRAAMRAAMQKALEHSEDKVLALRADGKLSGVAVLLIEPENRYLQTAGVYTDSPQFYRALAEYLKENYPGYELMLGFTKENELAARALGGMGALCVDSCVTLRLRSQDFAALPRCAQVRELDRAGLGAFGAMHDARNPEMYWTSARILESLDKWRIFAFYSREALAGYLLCAVWHPEEAEIYCITVDMALAPPDAHAMLLNSAIPDIFSLGKEYIQYMIDDGAESELSAALNAGFEQTASYVCFKLTL